MANNKQDKEPLTDEEKAKRKRLIFIASAAGVLILAIIYMLNYEPPTMAENFYENRKSVESYQEYKDSDSAKRKAERNVFLQD